MSDPVADYFSLSRDRPMVTWHVPNMTFDDANRFAQYVRALPKVSSASVTAHVEMRGGNLWRTPTLRIIAREGAGTPEEFQNLVQMYAVLWWEGEKKAHQEQPDGAL